MVTSAVTGNLPGHGFVIYVTQAEGGSPSSQPYSLPLTVEVPAPPKDTDVFSVDDDSSDDMLSEPEPDKDNVPPAKMPPAKVSAKGCKKPPYKKSTLGLNSDDSYNDYHSSEDEDEDGSNASDDGDDDQLEQIARRYKKSMQHNNHVTPKAKPSTNSASTTAAKQGGGVILVPPSTGSKKPKDALLRSCIRITQLPNGMIRIECLKCPHNIPQQPYVKEWQCMNATLVRRHLTTQCMGISGDLQYALIQSEFTNLIIYLQSYQ